MKHQVILLALVLLAACNSDDSPDVMPVPEREVGGSHILDMGYDGLVAGDSHFVVTHGLLAAVRNAALYSGGRPGRPIA